MPKPPRTLLLTSLAVGAAACGAALAFLALSGRFDARVAAGGVLAASGLSASLLALAWARRCARKPLQSAPRPEAGTSRPGLTVIPLGGGETAVIFEEPQAGCRAGPPGLDCGARRDAALTADAIWRAVDAAVSDASRSRPRIAPPRGPRSLLDRARRRSRRGPGPDPGSDPTDKSR